MTKWLWLGVIGTLTRFILCGYYHPAFDFNLDGILNVCDLQYAINALLVAPF